MYDKIIQLLKETGSSLDECITAVITVETHLIIEKFIKEASLEEVTLLWKELHKNNA